MAGRLPKQRIDYFSLEVDYYADPKFVRLRTEFGIKGEICAIRVLCAIYREGYYIQCSEDLLYGLADDTKLTYQFIKEVVTGMVRCGLFDKAIFENDQVLTSAGIQRRWFHAKARSKKVDTSQFWLLDNNVCKNDINAYINEEIEYNNQHIISNHIISHDLNRIDIISSRSERAVSLYVDNFGVTGKGILEEMIEFYGPDLVFEAVNKSIGKAKTVPIKYVNEVCMQLCNYKKEYKLKWSTKNEDHYE